MLKRKQYNEEQMQPIFIPMIFVLFVIRKYSTSITKSKTKIMMISSIVAMNREGLIGSNNQIPWYLPADLKYFKKQTTGHHILMGRKCFKSISKPLPNRTNIIVTRDPYFIVSNGLIVHSIEEGIQLAMNSGEEELFIIGGGEIYNQSMNYCHKLYVTWIEIDLSGEIYFPEIDWNQWKLISEEKHEKDEINFH